MVAASPLLCGTPCVLIRVFLVHLSSFQPFLPPFSSLSSSNQAFSFFVLSADGLLFSYGKEMFPLQMKCDRVDTEPPFSPSAFSPLCSCDDPADPHTAHNHVSPPRFAPSPKLVPPRVCPRVLPLPLLFINHLIVFSSGAFILPGRPEYGALIPPAMPRSVAACYSRSSCVLDLRAFLFVDTTPFFFFVTFGISSALGRPSSPSRPLYFSFPLVAHGVSSPHTFWFALVMSDPTPMRHVNRNSPETKLSSLFNSLRSPSPPPDLLTPT